MDRQWLRAPSRRELGAEGEAQAADFLRRRGYRIVARGVRADRVEIDLIVRKGRLVVFVEVKTRRTRTHGPPELAVDARKQARLVRGAAAWLRESRLRGVRVRFDVVTCEPDVRGQWLIRHWEGAFDAGG